MKCFECDKPATLQNHTQFAGTHYWCDAHVPPEDRADCTTISSAEVNPANLTVKFTDTGSGWGSKQYKCEMYYHDHRGHFRTEANERSAHRARMTAFNELEALLVEHTTAPLTSQPPNPYTNDRVQYLLDKLQEEAAEVIQAVSKIRRFGPHNHHPDRTETNLQELTGELEDFQAIVWALEEIKYLDPKPSTTSIIKKYNTLMG